MTGLAQQIAAHRRGQTRRGRQLLYGLLALLLAGLALTLMVGQTLTPPFDVLRVLAGHDVPRRLLHRRPAETPSST
ncbi:hypothetical protein FAZ78_25375, partial [Cereibacter changlensis]